MADAGRQGKSPAANARAEHKLFVGGIPHRFNDSDLKEEFAHFGARRATVMIDRKTNRSRGFGFVFVRDRIGCERAIAEMHDKVLEGRTVSVRMAVPELQTLPGTPANILATGRGNRRSRSIGAADRRGDNWSPRGGSYSRFLPQRADRGGHKRGSSMLRSISPRQSNDSPRGRERSLSTSLERAVTDRSRSPSRAGIVRGSGVCATDWIAVPLDTEDGRAMNWRQSTEWNPLTLTPKHQRSFQEYLQQCSHMHLGRLQNDSVSPPAAGRFQSNSPPTFRGFDRRGARGGHRGGGGLRGRRDFSEPRRSFGRMATAISGPPGGRYDRSLK